MNGSFISSIFVQCCTRGNVGAVGRPKSLSFISSNIARSACRSQYGRAVCAWPSAPSIAGLLARSSVLRARPGHCAHPAVGPSRVFGRSERRSVAPCAAEQFLALPDLDATCPSNCVDCLQGVRPRDMVFPGLLVFRPESVPGLPTPGRLRTAPNAGCKALSQVLQTRAWGCASMGA